MKITQSPPQTHPVQKQQNSATVQRRWHNSDLSQQRRRRNFIYEDVLVAVGSVLFCLVVPVHNFKFSIQQRTAQHTPTAVSFSHHRHCHRRRCLCRFLVNFFLVVSCVSDVIVNNKNPFLFSYHWPWRSQYFSFCFVHFGDKKLIIIIIDWRHKRRLIQQKKYNIFCHMVRVRMENDIITLLVVFKHEKQRQKTNGQGGPMKIVVHIHWNGGFHPEYRT